MGFWFFFSPPYKTSKYKNLKTPSKAERDVENLNGHLEKNENKKPPRITPKNEIPWEVLAGGEGVCLGTRVWPMGTLSKTWPPKKHPHPTPKAFWNPPGKDFGVQTVLGEAQGRTRVGRGWGGTGAPKGKGLTRIPPSGKAFPGGTAGGELGAGSREWDKWDEPEVAPLEGNPGNVMGIKGKGGHTARAPLEALPLQSRATK